MTQTRIDLPNKPIKEKKTSGLLRHAFNAAVTTFVCQPLRSLMVNASQFQSPMPTFRYGLPNALNGISINVVRGTAALGVQAGIKETVQDYAGLPSALGAAGLMGGAIASLLETPFIRRTLNAPTLWRFTPTLFRMYCLREFSFSMAVFTKNDLSPTAQFSALFAATALTASLQKLITFEASRDTFPPEITAPNFSQDGVVKTLQSMANGRVYTHPAFQVPFSNPQNVLAKTGNFLHVTCGANMFLFRLIHLTACTQVYNYFANNTFSFFNSPSTVKNNDLDDTNLKKVSMRKI